MELSNVRDAAPEQPAQRLQATIQRSMLAGFKLVVPLAVTVVLVGFAVGFLFRVLTPAIRATDLVSGGSLSAPMLKGLTVVGLLGIIFVIGYIAERRNGEGEVLRRFDETMGNIPGAGSVYTSSRRMSDILIDADSRSFREVKIVEYPSKGLFTLGFLTDDSPASVVPTSEDGLQALFIPFSPNPFMGGFLVYASDDQVHDIDMTVKQAVSTIMTSGVTGTTADQNVSQATTTEQSDD